MKDLYKILNLNAAASDDAVKSNYRTLAKRYHPDLNPGNATAAKRFAEINEAYDILSDAQKRAAYDAEVRAEAAKARARAQAQAYARQQSAYQTARPGVRTNAQPKASGYNAVYEAQLQADANAVLKSVYDNGYKEGYAAGHKSASAQSTKLNAAYARLGQENAALKKSAASFKNDRSELENELFDRDREIARGHAKIKELEAQLQWMRRASVTSTGASPAAKHASTSKERVQNLKRSLAKFGGMAAKTEDTTVLAQNERRKEIDERLLKLDKELAAITNEIKEMDDRNERRHNTEEANRMLSSMETNAKQWAEKTFEDQKLASGTLYGALGVLIWATDKQIEQAFDKLMDHITDDDAKQTVQRAYAVLYNHKSRAEYNKSIGITDERIEKERALIKQNEAAQEKYRSKLAAKEFWARFDELSSLALAGDAEAQNLLGEMYYKGDTLERDITHAVYWFREAYANKLPAAMYNLGICYQNGDGVHKNAAIATALFRQASLRGYDGQ